jgi:hypothetical protein
MFYIYALVCPITGDVRYIGKTRMSLIERLEAHIRHASSGRRGHCQAWIRKLERVGLQPRIEPVVEGDDADDWQALEKATITAFLEAGSPLTNMTGGGDGFHKLDPDALRRRVESRRVTMSAPDQRELASKRSRERWERPGFRANISAKMREKMADPKYRAVWMQRAQCKDVIDRRSATYSALFDDPNYREKHSKRVRDRWADPEFRVRALEALNRFANDPDVRKRRSDSLRRFYRDPAARQKAATILAEINARPDVQKKRAAARKRLWADARYRERMLSLLRSEEFRAAQSERLKARWADPSAREKMEARWTPEKRRAQADRVRQTNARTRNDPAFVKARNEVLKRARKARWDKVPRREGTIRSQLSPQLSGAVLSGAAPFSFEE